MVFKIQEDYGFVFEVQDQRNLFLHLFQHLRFNEERTRFYAASILFGLKYFHNLDIPYRNLNLKNILVGNDGYICLTDYGMARLMKLRKKNLKRFFGTPYYLAPEVIRGEK